MPAWCSTPDDKAVKAEIEIESTRRGWDLLSCGSPKVQFEAGETQRRQCIPHLQRAYPKPQKDTAAWLQFIKKTTGQFKKWNSLSSVYTQASNQTHNATTSDARLERRACTGLSPDSRKERGLELSPEEEKVLAREVNVNCVCVFT